MKPTCLLYKVLSEDGRSTFQEHPWPLPSDDKPGEWVEAKGKIVICRNGPHATTNPFRWRIPDARLFVAEVDGAALYQADKCVAERMRLLYEITAEMATNSADYRIRAFFAHEGIRLQDADLQGADLQGANLQGANLHGAKLQYARLQGAKLQNANLQNADLQYADLHSADLRGADLRGADLYGADLYDADLHGANLHGVNLQGADLRDANLHGANLHGVNLQGADLRDADLQGADLQGAELWGAIGLPEHLRKEMPNESS